MADEKKEAPSCNARRGFVPEDMRQFTGEALEKLKKAAEDTRRGGYPPTRMWRPGGKRNVPAGRRI